MCSMLKFKHDVRLLEIYINHILELCVAAMAIKYFGAYPVDL